MDDLLFLAHRIPYPPNKGDKIRSYHLLAHLARRYRVHLGAFVDDPADWQHTATLRALCADTCFVGLHPQRARLLSLRGLLRGEALSLAYYRNRTLAAWVERVLAQTGLTRVLVFSGAMAQYVHGPAYANLQRVVDFVDVDSDKWAQYSRAKSWPMNWLYRREAATLLRFERAVAQEAAAAVFVSDEEAALFRTLAPAAPRLAAIHNGVDTAYFDPALAHANPYAADERVLVFTGAMDYWANVDAVRWFADSVWPRVRAAVPGARFYIVGSRPAAAVRELAARPGVCVTGAVPDVRPYLAHACAAVAPLRIARGVQNKVLEALAMARPVLATPAAAEGIHACPPLARWTAAEPAEVAQRAVLLLTAGAAADGAAGRQFVLAHYRWEDNMQRLEHLLERADDQRPTVAAEVYL